MGDPLIELSERDWQRQVLELARMFTWRIAHFRPAKTSKGWKTAVAADGAGWPDLCLVRGRVVWIENKREKGHLEEEQVLWIRALHAADAEIYVARPRHLQQLSWVLTQPRRPEPGQNPHGDGLLEELVLHLADPS